MAPCSQNPWLAAVQKVPRIEVGLVGDFRVNTAPKHTIPEGCRIIANVHSSLVIQRTSARRIGNSNRNLGRISIR